MPPRIDSDFPSSFFEAQLARVYRHAVYARRLKSLGEHTYISPYVTMQDMARISVGARTQISRGSLVQVVSSYEGRTYDPEIVIGDDVYLGRRCSVSCMNRISIGNQVTFGDNVYVADSNHGYELLDRSVLRQPLVGGSIAIGEGAWLGYGVVVAGTVTIGAHTVVGANSVVTRSLPDRVVAVGAPARIVKRYDDAQGRWVRVDD